MREREGENPGKGGIQELNPDLEAAHQQPDAAGPTGELENKDVTLVRPPALLFTPLEY